MKRTECFSESYLKRVPEQQPRIARKTGRYVAPSPD
jgi:hypothetical protein